MRSRTQRLAETGLRARLSDERLLFVVVSVATSLLMLGRSYVAMLTLDERGLGTVTLVQTVVLFVSTLQLGMLQGGYRLLCNGESEDRTAINNLLYALFAALTLLAIVGSAAAMLTGSSPAFVLLGLCGASIGVLTLNRNWIANQLIAMQSLSLLNRLTLWASILSLLPLLAAPVAPLEAVVISLALQPLLFVGFALAGTRGIRPTALRFDRPLASRIFAAGFTLFLAGMLLQANILVERWFVTSSLGIEVLGHLFLLTLYVSLFQLVPNALDALFLPRLVSANQVADNALVKATLRAFMGITVLYCAGIALVTVFAARPVLEMLLPGRAADLRYVFIALPGLILFTLSGPFAILFNTLIRYRALFAAYGAGTILTIAVLALAAAETVNLGADGVVVLRSAAQATTAALLVAGWAWLSRSHRQFRFI